MRFRNFGGIARAAGFDKARWVGTQPRYRTDRYLVIHLVHQEEEPDRAEPDGRPPDAQPPAPPPP